MMQKNAHSIYCHLSLDSKNRSNTANLSKTMQRENRCTFFFLHSNALSLTFVLTFFPPSSYRKQCYVTTLLITMCLVSQIKCHFNDREWMSSCLPLPTTLYRHFSRTFTIENWGYFNDGKES